jgi:hypothetical protein
MTSIARAAFARALLVVVCLLLFPYIALGQPLGKCCLPDGRGCVNDTASGCDSRGGVFIAGQACASPDDTCDGPPTGACCPADGSACVVTPSTACGTGVFHLGTSCSPTPCLPPPTGACCNGGSCSVGSQAICISGGGEWYQGLACTADFCHLGACCITSLACVVISHPGCEQGTWSADGTCVAGYCLGPTGSCCRSTGACVVTLGDDCLNGTYIGGGICAGVSCALEGACCHGTECTITSGTACGSGGGTYRGDGVACGGAANPVACCAANFDGIGGLGVQDIFAFLNAWFVGDPRADFSGGGLGVQDIFDFLAAWFVGC